MAGNQWEPEGREDEAEQESELDISRRLIVLSVVIFVLAATILVQAPLSPDIVGFGVVLIAVAVMTTVFSFVRFKNEYKNWSHRDNNYNQQTQTPGRQISFKESAKWVLFNQAPRLGRSNSSVASSTRSSEWSDYTSSISSESSSRSSSFTGYSTAPSESSDQGRNADPDWGDQITSRSLDSRSSSVRDTDIRKSESSRNKARTDESTGRLRSSTVYRSKLPGNTSSNPRRRNSCSDMKERPRRGAARESRLGSRGNKG